MNRFLVGSRAAKRHRSVASAAAASEDADIGCEDDSCSECEAEDVLNKRRLLPAPQGMTVRTAGLPEKTATAKRQEITELLKGRPLYVPVRGRTSIIWVYGGVLSSANSGSDNLWVCLLCGESTKHDPKATSKHRNHLTYIRTFASHRSNLY